MNKKAQGEIITTVLIILLVLAAVIIVWQAVRGTVTSASNTVTSQSQCIGIDLAIDASCVKTTSLSVAITRGADSAGAGKLIVTAAVGTTKAGNASAAGINTLDVKQFAVTDFTGLAATDLADNTKVAINTGIILVDGTTCKGSSATITCK